MHWGNWELVVSEHPPVLRNPGWSDVVLDESCGYWGIAGSILDAWDDEKYELSKGNDYIQTAKLLDALHAICSHGMNKSRGMSASEAAYSYAASKGSN
jgi:hypothetical protein